MCLLHLRINWLREVANEDLVALNYRKTQLACTEEIPLILISDETLDASTGHTDLI